MVAGRTHRGERDGRLAGDQRADHLAGPAGGVVRRAARGLADERVGVDRPAAERAQLGDPVDHRRIVHGLELGVTR